MRIYRHFRDVAGTARGAAAALGNFDGVHRGHQALLEETGRLARAGNTPFAALVFEPSPREFFRPDAEPYRLTPLRAKARLLAGLGVDELFVLEFDAKLAATLAQDFVLDVLVKELAVRHVVVGEDFRFGKGRAGDATVLAYMGEMEGFGVTVFPALSDGKEAKISSSRIRAALREGKPEEAARLLGHWWSVEGHVAHGDKRAETLGHPTANMTLAGTLQPIFGVYAVRAYIGAEENPRDGVANFGRRPTFGAGAPLFEVHLFDYSGDLYGALLRVELIAFLRAEKKFENVEALKRQIAADSAQARALLKQSGRSPI